MLLVQRRELLLVEAEQLHLGGDLYLLLAQRRQLLVAVLLLCLRLDVFLRITAKGAIKGVTFNEIAGLVGDTSFTTL